MNTKTVRIMIVDDDQDLAESLGRPAAGLRLRRHRRQQRQGRAAARAGSDFDVTFMDVRMPVMNGVDSCLAIKKIKPQARIVMMTGFKEPILAKAIGGRRRRPAAEAVQPRGHAARRQKVA